MASLVRPWIVRYYVGRRRVPKGTPGAKPRRSRARKWYGQGIPGIRGRVPLSTDRRAAERMLADLVSKGEQSRAGIVRDEPIAPLVEEWSQVVGRSAGTAHARTAVRECRAVLAACKVVSLSDLNARDLTARAESYIWSLTRGKQPRSGRTAASYGKHTRQFTRWLWRRKGLLASDPLAGLDLPSERPSAPRRALTPGELAALVDAAERGDTLHGLSGPDRALLYLTAAGTGLRREELAGLTPGHFDLGAEPRVMLPGSETKSGEAADQPLPPGLATRLRVRLAGLKPTAPVWPGNWYHRTARMLRADLAAAGIPARTAAGTLVFHSLRHTYTTMLAEVAPVRVTQDLSRHADPALTIGRYAHSTPAARRAAVEALPLPGTGPADLTREQIEGLAAVGLVLFCWLIPGIPRGK